MAVEAQRKTELIEKYRMHGNDTGSPEVQVALLSNRITELTAHLREHKHDESSRRGLLKMVSKRKKLMSYLEKTNEKSYKEVIKTLGL